MKTAIVTFNRAYNYGAVLQCYALYKKLSDIGLDVEVLDYFPDYFKDTYSLAYLDALRYFPYRPLSNWFKFLPLTYIRNRRLKIFDSFLSKHIKLSMNQYKTKEELNNSSLPYGAYIVGSDQVWTNIWTNFDSTFFLEFAKQNTKKISYAASFGFNKIPENLFLDYKKRLSNWDMISVREKTGQKILTELGVTESSLCCDPTILLTAKEWLAISSTQKHPKSPYILVYSVNSLEKTCSIAHDISYKKQMDTFVISSIASEKAFLGEVAKRYSFHNLWNTSPNRFLELFYNAEYIVTDSFHGTVFSLLFHKKFILLSNINGKENQRALDLLDYVGISQTIETNANIDNTLDWSKIDDSLSKYRQSSLDYLYKIREVVK